MHNIYFYVGTIIFFVGIILRIYGAIKYFKKSKSAPNIQVYQQELRLSYRKSKIMSLLIIIIGLIILMID